MKCSFHKEIKKIIFLDLIEVTDRWININGQSSDIQTNKMQLYMYSWITLAYFNFIHIFLASCSLILNMQIVIVFWVMGFWFSLSSFIEDISLLLHYCPTFFLWLSLSSLISNFMPSKLQDFSKTFQILNTFRYNKSFMWKSLKLSLYCFYGHTHYW